MKQKDKMQEQESPSDMDSMVAAEAVEQEEAKGRGMEWQETADAAASCISLNVAPKCKKKKKKKKKNLQGQLESPPDKNSTAAAEVEEQGVAKGNGMEEWKAPDDAAFALNDTPKCKKKNNNMLEQQEPPLDLDSAAAAQAEEQVEAKGREREERKATDAAAPVLEGTPKCDDDEETKVKGGVMLKEKGTGTVVSEGTPKRKKRKRKSKMLEQPESKQTLSGVVGVNKIVSNNYENGCAHGMEASGRADVNMNPINANVADVLIENCSENSNLLQESSAGIKRRKKKRKRGSSSRGPGLHDRSCICGPCLVEAHKEKFKHNYSLRSLVRFQRKKLLILDLNGLLVDINQDTHNAHKAHAKVRGKLVFKRPYCDDFLRFCFENFELGIWSSRKRENVNVVVNFLMSGLKPYLLFRWDMSHCTFTGCKTIENKHKPLVLKELKKLWNKEKMAMFSPSNTLLVDDSPYKALCNPPNTAIFPHPYSYHNERDDYSLGPDGDLRKYLERIASADNVQNFVRDNPFGQNSITESDPNWNFYAQIVNKVNKVQKQVADKVEKQIADEMENQIADKVDSQIADKVGIKVQSAWDGQEAAIAATSCISLNVAPKCKKKKKKKKKNNKLQEQKESPPDMGSAAAAEVEEQGEAKGNGMEERKATDAAAFALNGTPKCNKKAKKNNKMLEQQEPPLDLDSAAVAEAEEQGEAMGRGMEKQKATDAAASVLEGTPKCDEEAKVKDGVMLKEEGTGAVVSGASEGTPKRKRKKKNKMQQQPESKQALPGVGVNNIVSNNLKIAAQME